jgi:hypothetical protein
MKNLKCLLSVAGIFLIASYHVNGQHAIVSAGGNSAGGNSAGSVSWSLGQLITECKTNSTVTVMQGVQVPYEIFVVSENTGMFIDLEAAAYPNPVSEELILSIEMKDFREMEYVMTDFNGKVLVFEKITSSETRLDMTRFPSAVYFITVNPGSVETKTFKIIKY